MTEFRNIYVSGRGDDQNDGRTPATPLRTLAAAQQRLDGGTALLLEGGYAYSGSLLLEGLRDVRLGRYGTGLPRVESGDADGVRIRNSQNVLLAGWKLIGRGWASGNRTSGVHMLSSQNVTVKNLEVTGYHTAGIGIVSCRDTTILGCFVHDNGAGGIHTGSVSQEDVCYNTRIAYCRVYDNAGDYGNRYNHSGSGIVIAGADKTVVEFCEAAANGWAQRQYNVNGPVGIWCCCGCTNALFRYNIARYNRTQPGAVDGDGLDVDGESNNCLLEYNYTYGNEGSGYLFCEFYGDCTDTLWFNNAMRYCVSFEDDNRVGNYGALAISSPEDIPFHHMYIYRNLFVGHGDKKTIYNRQIPACAEELYITENTLVTSCRGAISDVSHANMTISDNAEIADEAVQRALIARAPLLSEPRDLLRQPVFRLLQEGNCADVLREKGAEALFVSSKKPALAEGFRMMELQLYGPDLEGSDKNGDVALYYDTLASSVVTRMAGAGAEVSTPLPWWTKDRRYIVRVKARLQSPDVKAYLFLNNVEREEARVYLHGSVQNYVYAELPFVGNEKWFDAGKYVGVHVESGSGSLYVYSLEFIELPENSVYTPAEDYLALDSYCSFGDVYEEDETLVLEGGAFVERQIPVINGRVTVRLALAGETAGCCYLRDAADTVKAVWEPGQDAAVLQYDTGAPFVTLGIAQECFAQGRLLLRGIAVE